MLLRLVLSQLPSQGRVSGHIEEEDLEETSGRRSRTEVAIVGRLDAKIDR